MWWFGLRKCVRKYRGEKRYLFKINVLAESKKRAERSETTVRVFATLCFCFWLLVRLKANVKQSCANVEHFFIS